MIKYVTLQSGKYYLNAHGSIEELGCDAAYMITLIYKRLFNVNPESAAVFRRATMYAINSAMDAIERGELDK